MNLTDKTIFISGTGKFRRYCLVLLLLLGCGNVLKAQSRRIDVLFDNPMKSKPVALSLSPFYVDYSKLNMHLGWSTRLNVRLFHQGEWRAEYRRSYRDFNGHDMSDAYTPVSNVKNSILMETGFSYFFFNRTRPSITKVELAKKKVHDGTETTLLLQPSQSLWQGGIRGGYIGYQTMAYLNILSADNFNVIEDDGSQELTGAQKNGAYSMFTSKSLYLGLHWKSTADVVVKSPVYGIKKGGWVYDMALDIVYALDMQFGNVWYKQVNYQVNPDTKKMHALGWRFEFKMRPSNRFRADYKIEFGSRPGYKSEEKVSFKSETVYILFNIGLNLPLGKRVKYMDEK